MTPPPRSTRVFLVEQEGTGVLFPGPSRDDRQGRTVLVLLHTDQGSQYFLTPKAGEKVSKEHRDPGRAGPGRSLGSRHIPSYHSPTRPGAAWSGSGEPLQGRLPQLLRLEQITTIEAANRFLATEVYLAEHNANFAVAAAEGRHGFHPLRRRPRRRALRQALKRQVGNDNCVRFGKLLDLQIPSSATEGTTCGSPFRCAITPMAHYPSSTVLAGSPTTPPKEP